MPAAVPTRRGRVDGHDVVQLDRGWVATAVTSDGDANATRPGERSPWQPAQVPGTAAKVLADAGQPAGDLDAEDWWFKTTFTAATAGPGEEVVLCLDGIATLAEVFLDGDLLLSSESMFERHEIEVGDRLRGESELLIHCRALGPALRVARKPRARWRTRLVTDGGLRWFRTMLIGRAPGFAPGPPAVGPWRPIRLERRRNVVVERVRLRPELDGDDGILDVQLRLRALGGRTIDAAFVEVDGPTGRARERLDLQVDRDGVAIEGTVRIPQVARWWPHTHGDPALYAVRVAIDLGDRSVSVDAGRVGFRTLAAGPTPDHDIERDGLDLHINGVRVFARGAVWTPIDPIGLAPSTNQLRAAIQTVRDAGMNVLRVPGTGAYETDAFHDLCDELGILVWQDLMFANLDYPFADDAFRATAEREVTDVIEGLAGRPSLAVVCGNSEIEQQVAMLGLDPGLGRGGFFGSTVPGILAASGAEAVYVPSAPFGGDLPFRPDRGVANYYGVGGYRRPLVDARVAGVRFAAECLAFANVPDESVVDELLAGSSIGPIDDPRWKASVPRDVGADWDFDDVRDHYLASTFGVDPLELRLADPDRYLELSRAVSGEVMSEVFGEWRRAGSPCGGGLVLWLRDLVPGAGWGVLDNLGSPKVAYHHLRRILAPVAVWTTDEGLGGILIHAANDGTDRLEARLRVALYRDFEQPVWEGMETIQLPPHGTLERNVETLLGQFVDAAWAYRFGPAGHDAVVVSLERDDASGTELLSQAFRFPAGRPLVAEAADVVGLEAIGRPEPDGTVKLSIVSTRLAYGVRIHLHGASPSDDAFSIEPGHTREIVLGPSGPGIDLTGGTLTALNVAGSVRIEMAVGTN